MPNPLFNLGRIKMSSLTQLIDQHFDTRQKIFEHFGYSGEIKDICFIDLREFRFKVRRTDNITVVHSLLIYTSDDDDDSMDYLRIEKDTIRLSCDGLCAYIAVDDRAYITRNISNFIILDSAKEIK